MISFRLLFRLYGQLVCCNGCTSILFIQCSAFNRTISQHLIGRMFLVKRRKKNDTLTMRSRGRKKKKMKKLCESIHCWEKSSGSKPPKTHEKTKNEKQKMKSYRYRKDTTCTPKTTQREKCRDFQWMLFSLQNPIWISVLSIFLATIKNNIFENVNQKSSLFPSVYYKKIRARSRTHNISKIKTHSVIKPVRQIMFPHTHTHTYHFMSANVTCLDQTSNIFKAVFIFLLFMLLFWTIWKCS